MSKNILKILLLGIFQMSFQSDSSLHLQSIEAQMGPDGTDDEVSLTICHVAGSSHCCETEVLNSAWTNDWSSNDDESWGKSWLADCAEFSIDPSETTLSVILYKDGGDDLHVNQLLLRAANAEGNQEFDFNCGELRTVGGQHYKSAYCRKA